MKHKGRNEDEIRLNGESIIIYSGRGLISIRVQFPQLLSDSSPPLLLVTLSLPFPSFFLCFCFYALSTWNRFPHDIMVVVYSPPPLSFCCCFFFFTPHQYKII